MRQLEKNCKNKNTTISSIKFDSCYLLSKDANGVHDKFKGANGVHDKFVGAPTVGSMKKGIWVPNSLVTNLGGPKQVWVSKRN